MKDKVSVLQEAVGTGEVDKINSQFNSELQQQIDGMLPIGHIYKLGNPGANLLSAGLPDFPIELNAERLIKKASKRYGHPFDLSRLKDLPKAIQIPIMVFDSTKKDGSKVILIELQHKGSNFVVVMRLQYKGRGRGNPQINDIRSIYPKDNISGIIDWINSKDNLLCWADKEKALRFVSVQSTNLIGNGNKTQDSTYNIVNNFANVKLKS